MPLVVVQTTIPGTDAKPFRITEVLGRVADNADEALEAAAYHIGDAEHVSDFLTARWHAEGGYWLVSYEPVPEI
ncbi:MAG TPA: hypothetical protein VLL76_03355, partial [Candidatus Omnitrophota bacterium]|nr:hypothetical protein [Candidatus Omnitrophota bacterium]